MGKIARIKDNKLYLKGVVTEIPKKTYELYFNGVNPAITILNTNNRLQPGNQFTWEMWFKLDGYTQYNTLMGFNSNDLDFGRMDSTTSFRCHTWNSSGGQAFVDPSGFDPVNDGKWHHMAIVWDGVNGESWGFIDGVQRDYATYTQGTQIKSTANHGTFTIGGSNSNGRLIKGWIREVRMWQKARTHQEILDDMNTELIGNETGLFLYLPLNEGKGEIIKDKASGFEANINGAIWEDDTESLELDGVLRGWSGGYTTNPETPNIYYVEGLRGGFMFPQSIFEVGETYTLSFKTIKTSGDILTVGGHSQSFEDVEVYLDGKLIGNNWGSGLQDTYPNDNLEHNYKVILTFNGSAVDSNLYVQINRDNGYATEYTAEVYDLKLEKINKIPPNLSLDNTGGLTTLNEVIEYPIELEGGRNLLPTEYESFVVDDGTYGWIKLADEGTPLTVKVYDTGANVDMGSAFFGLTKIGKDFTGGGSFWLMANGNLSRTEGQTDEAMYFSFYGKSRVTFDKIFEKYKVKVEIGNEATPWTPAPEDLGLDYPSDIQYFHMGIKDNILMINELIEGGV